mgnify:CR=1 FL=1
MIKDFVSKKPALFIFNILLSVVSMGSSAIGSVIFAYSFNALNQRNLAKFVQMNFLFFAFSILSDVTTYLFCVYSKKMIQNYNHDLRYHYIQSLIKKTNFSEIDVNKHINALTNDLLLLSEKYLWGFLKMVNAVFKIGFSIFALFTFHWSLVLASMFFAALMLTAPEFFNKRLTKVTEDISLSNQKLISTLNDWLGGLYDLSWSQVTNKLWSIISTKATELEDSYIEEAKINSFVGEWSNIISNISTVSLTILASILYFNGLVPFGIVVNIGSFIFSIFTGLVTISNNIATHISGKPISKKYQEILYTVDNRRIEKNILLPNMSVKLCANNLSYRYKDKIIKYPDFNIKQGDKVALVGPSGVGKTTLINILSGELSDYSGEFTLNGQEIKDISLNSLHHLIGIVPQHSHLFRTTIAENVLLFDETLEDKLPDALNEVNLSAVVGNLQHGIDTVVGPNDEKLSGGELQRISLARALIRNKEFLIIDEGTSALDESNARDIVRRLLSKKSITLLMITHTSDRKLLSEFDQIIQLS